MSVGLTTYQDSARREDLRGKTKRKRRQKKKGRRRKK